jgi:hypothetical protein
MSEDDDDDYMSAAFLVDAEKQDSAAKRTKELNNQATSQPKSARKQLQEGLSTPLDESNLGFKMLQKMGCT